MAVRLRCWDAGGGWVNAAGLDRTDETAASTCTEKFDLPGQKFTVGINGTNCDGPTKVKLKAGMPFCAVVYPTPLEGQPRECKHKIRSITGEQAKRGYTVEWRYVTKGRKYVPIKDRHYSNPEGSWGFIHRSALPDRLCRRTQRQCDPDNNGPR